MAHLIPDDYDFGAYERATEFKAKVRAASDFSDDLLASFAPRIGPRRAFMGSTKLRTAIEFRPGEVTTWAGFNGHRKSHFTGQVVLDLIDQAERTLMLSLEMEPRDTLHRMAQIACAARVPNTSKLREFMRWTDDRLWLFNHIGRLTPSKCLAVMRYFAEELQGQHVFIDSFMKVCESEESLDEQKAMVGNLCDVAKETGLHVHLVAHCRKPNGGDEHRLPTKYDIKGSGAISDQSHNVIMIWENKVRRAEAEKKEPNPEIMNKPDAMVCIEKQRNGSFEGKFALYIDPFSLRFCDDRLSPVEPYVMEVM